jgi:hypothetical protein
MPIYDRQAIVVLGMHRSGTSAVAGTAVRLGLAPPRTPLPAADDNPGGFYESLPVVELNHQILRAAGCAWNLCLTLEPERVAQDLRPEFRHAILRTLQQEFDDSSGFVLKDPRLCLTLPAWLPSLRAIGTVPSVLIVVRHPGDVVRSLFTRNKLPEAETAPHWLHHMLEAERCSRGLPRAVVFYEDLLRDWRGCVTDAARKAAIVWPRPTESAARAIDNFLGGSPRADVVPPMRAFVGPPEVRELVHAVWTTFRYLEHDPVSSVAAACLDQVWAEFAIWRRRAWQQSFRVVPPAA